MDRTFEETSPALIDIYFSSLSHLESMHMTPLSVINVSNVANIMFLCVPFQNKRIWNTNIANWSSRTVFLGNGFNFCYTTNSNFGLTRRASRGQLGSRRVYFWVCLEIWELELQLLLRAH